MFYYHVCCVLYVTDSKPVHLAVTARFTLFVSAHWLIGTEIETETYSLELGLELGLAHWNWD